MSASPKQKDKLIDQLRKFIDIYDRANIEEIVKQVLSDADDDTIASYRDRIIKDRQAFYDQVAQELSEPLKEKQEGGGRREEDMEKKEKIVYLMQEHDENITMMNEVINELEAADATVTLLEECEATKQTLQAEIGRLGTSETPPVLPPKTRTVRPSALVSTGPTASVAKISVKSTASQKPGRRLIPTASGRMASVRIKCSDRGSQSECALDETPPCYWVPGNEPPCLTGTEYGKVSRKKSVSVRPVLETPIQRATSSRVSVAVPAATAKASTKASARGGTLEDLYAQALARIRTYGSKEGMAFNNYLRGRYQDNNKTISRLTVNQYRDILALSDAEWIEKMKDPIGQAELDLEVDLE